MALRGITSRAGGSLQRLLLRYREARPQFTNTAISLFKIGEM